MGSESTDNLQEINRNILLENVKDCVKNYSPLLSNILSFLPNCYLGEFKRIDQISLTILRCCFSLIGSRNPLPAPAVSNLDCMSI